MEPQKSLTKDRAEEILQTFIDPYRPLYSRQALKLCRGNKEDAEDLLQDTIARVLEKADQYRSEAKISTWVIRVMISQRLTSERRPYVRRRKQVEDFNAMADNMTTPAPSQFQRYAMAEIGSLLSNAIEELPPEMHAAFVLRHVDKMRIREVADALEISEVAVKSRTFRAKKILRESLRDACPAGCR